MNVNVMGMDEISIDKARPKLGDLVHDAQNGTVTVITRNGKPAAVVAPLPAPAGPDQLQDRIRALDDHGRKSVLMYLCGYAPQGVAAALDEIESQAAAQATEDSHG